jgi:hypothetical protein
MFYQAAIVHKQGDQKFGWKFCTFFEKLSKLSQKFYIKTQFDNQNIYIKPLLKPQTSCDYNNACFETAYLGASALKREYLDSGRECFLGANNHK